MSKWVPLQEPAPESFLAYGFEQHAQNCGEVVGEFDDRWLLVLYDIKNDESKVLAGRELRYGAPVDYMVSNWELPEFLEWALPIVERVLRLDSDLCGESKPDKPHQEMMQTLDLIAEGIRGPWPKVLASEIATALSLEGIGSTAGPDPQQNFTLERIADAVETPKPVKVNVQLEQQQDAKKQSCKHKDCYRSEDGKKAVCKSCGKEFDI